MFKSSEIFLGRKKWLCWSHYMTQINLKCLFSMAEDESGNHIFCHILQNFIQIILFTYLYNSNPAYDSGLQNAIDKILKSKNIFLILCGSEVSVIEEIIDDSTKPLYQNKSYIIFSKNGVSSGVEKQLKDLPGYSVVTLDDLF